MKVRWNQEYKTKSVYVFITGALLMLFLTILLNLAGIFDALGTLLAIISPFIGAFAIAYILNRPMNFFEKKVFSFLNRSKPRPRLVRGLSVATVMLLFVAILGGLIAIIIPQLVASISNLIAQLPSYFQEFVAWLRGIMVNLHLNTAQLDQFAVEGQDFFTMILENVQKALPDLANTGLNLTISAVNFISSAFVAFIASIYLLLSKERFIMQTKKACFALLPKRFTENMIRVTRDSHIIFSNFISGKIIESLFVGTLTFIALMIIGIDYALLISVIMAIFNLIPFFGPFIGAIPSVLLLLMVNPMDALWFIIVTVVLQQIDGQIIGPKILGNSTGLTAFWVIFAIIVGGGLFGVLGMILGIPVFAVIYALAREFINARLKKKGLSTHTKDYHSEKNSI